MIRIGESSSTISGDNVVDLAWPASGACPSDGGLVAPAKGGLAPQQITRLQTIVRRDLQTNVSVNRLARECRLSVGYFTRAFRATTGTTPYRWLVGLRLDRAKSLLAAGTMPIAEIALICGFWDQAHFTRTFSRAVGASPAAWARRQRSAPSGPCRMPADPAYAA